MPFQHSQAHHAPRPSQQIIKKFERLGWVWERDEHVIEDELVYVQIDTHILCIGRAQEIAQMTDTQLLDVLEGLVQGEHLLLGECQI